MFNRTVLENILTSMSEKIENDKKWNKKYIAELEKNMDELTDKVFMLEKIFHSLYSISSAISDKEIYQKTKATLEESGLTSYRTDLLRETMQDLFSDN